MQMRANASELEVAVEERLQECIGDRRPSRRRVSRQGTRVSEGTSLAR